MCRYINFTSIYIKNTFVHFGDVQSELPGLQYANY